MKKLKHLTVCSKYLFQYCMYVSVMCLLAISFGIASTYYVATNGNDNSSGSKDNPFATIQKAADRVATGDTVYIRGGIYKITKSATRGAGIRFTKSGTSEKRICYWAYPNEIPVFDFSRMPISKSTYTHGFEVTGSWLHFKGLELCNVPMNINSNCAITVNNCSNNIFELLNLHHNNGTGIFIRKGRGGHLILNCDSHDNYDPDGRQGDGQNADGFGVHYQTSGAITIIRGCRAWWNSDDGYDLISQEVPVIIENCWAMGSGYANYGTTKPKDGNGAGFKVGSSKTGIRHIVRNCIAWKNEVQGFYANHSSGGNTWYNNTSYKNGRQYDMLASTWNASGKRKDGVILTGSKVHIMRNNIGFPNNNKNMNGVDSKFNTWDLNITPSEKDFLSIDDPSMTVKNPSVTTTLGALGPRQPDGSLPNVDFLKLAPESRMINAGTNVELPFEASAPDLGAYEYNEKASTMRYQPPTQRKRLFPEEETSIQKIHFFDISGRRLDSKMIQSLSKLFIYQKLQPNGSRRAYTILRIR